MTGLVEFAWKSTVVLAAAFALNYVLRNGSAAVRHFVWTAALAVLLPMAVVIGIGPRWNAAPVAAPAVVVTAVRSVAPAPTTVPARQMPLGWLYAAGVALVMLRFAVGIRRTNGLARRARSADFAADLVNELRASLRIARPVRVVAGVEILVPMAWGILQAVALLPEASRQWPTERLRTVLLHELMHISRHDLLAQTLAQLACCFFWFHPLVWLAARELRKERELACDDAVLSRGVAAPEYAGHLMAMARSLASPSAAPAMAETSDLESRIRALLDRGRNRAPLTRRVALTVAALTCALVLPMATLTTYAQANHGALAGLVKDPSGARIPGAAITAKNLDGTNVETTVADAAGEYGFRSIPAGRYEIEARVRGFAVLKMQTAVTAGVAARADLMMSVGGVTEVVTVRSTRTTPKPAEVPARAPERIPIGGNVQMAKLLKQPRAVYPQELKDQGVTGTVRIKAIISKNGDLLNPRVVNTVDPRLAQAAMDAVKNWLYEPARLNGQPIEVLTDIDVVFELDQ